MGSAGLQDQDAGACLLEGSQRLSDYPIGELESDLASLKQFDESLTE
jgi:hypothetical protein